MLLDQVEQRAQAGWRQQGGQQNTSMIGGAQLIGALVALETVTLRRRLSTLAEIIARSALDDC